jgi:hypothetical protein
MCLCGQGGSYGEHSAQCRGITHHPSAGTAARTRCLDEWRARPAKKEGGGGAVTGKHTLSTAVPVPSSGTHTPRKNTTLHRLTASARSKGRRPTDLLGTVAWELVSKRPQRRHTCRGALQVRVINRGGGARSQLQWVTRAECGGVRLRHTLSWCPVPEGKAKVHPPPLQKFPPPALIPYAPYESLAQYRAE